MGIGQKHATSYHLWNAKGRNRFDKDTGLRREVTARRICVRQKFVVNNI